MCGGKPSRIDLWWSMHRPSCLAAFLHLRLPDFNIAQQRSGSSPPFSMITLVRNVESAFHSSRLEMALTMLAVVLSWQGLQSSTMFAGLVIHSSLPIFMQRSWLMMWCISVYPAVPQIRHEPVTSTPYRFCTSLTV